MNCNCLAEVKADLLKHVAKRGAVNPRMSENFLGINLDTGEAIISMSYTLHADNRPYNTQKGKPVTMVASFCPFCGKSVKKKAQDATSAPVLQVGRVLTDSEGGHCD